MKRKHRKKVRKESFGNEIYSFSLIESFFFGMKQFHNLCFLIMILELQVIKVCVCGGNNKDKNFSFKVLKKQTG